MVDIEVEPGEEPPGADGFAGKDLPGRWQRLDQAGQCRLATEEAHLEIGLGRMGREQVVAARRQPVVVEAEHAPQDRAAATAPVALRAPCRDRLERWQVRAGEGQAGGMLHVLPADRRRGRAPQLAPGDAILDHGGGEAGIEGWPA